MNKKKISIIFTASILAIGCAVMMLGRSDTVSMLEIGHHNVAGITENGELYIWGNIDNGKFGDEFEKVTEPRKILEGNIVSIEIGMGFGGALDSDGILYMWGDNASGQLGIDSSENEEYEFDKGSDTIEAVAVMENVVSFDCGNSSTVVVTKEGEMYQWGNGNHNPTLIMENVKSVYASVDVSEGSRYAAITNDGALYSWGRNNDFSALGTGSNISETISAPQLILDDVIDVVLGPKHSAAITSDGSLYTWGSNVYGQLGNGLAGHDIRSYYPEKIMDNVDSVSLDDKNTAVITKDKELYIWGDNTYGQLGNKKGGSNINYFQDGVDSNIPVKIMDDVELVEVGAFHTAAIKTDGTLYIWGNNEYGQLGNGKSGGKDFSYDKGIDSNKPIKVMDDVADVQIDANNTAALTKDGKLYVWGYNECGQIGNGDEEGNVTKPTKVKLP